MARDRAWKMAGRALGHMLGRPAACAVVLTLAGMPRASLAQSKPMLMAETLKLAPTPGEGTLEESDLPAVSAALSLEPSQVTAAKLLFDGHAKAYAQTAARIVEEANAKLSTVNDPKDGVKNWQVLFERERHLADARHEVQDKLLTDFKSLLTREQQDRWPAVDRLLRRKGLASLTERHGVAWTSIDLFKITEQAELSDAERERLRPLLERYELELDNALVALNSARAAHGMGGLDALGALGGLEQPIVIDMPDGVGVAGATVDVQVDATVDDAGDEGESRPMTPARPAGAGPAAGKQSSGAEAIAHALQVLVDVNRATARGVVAALDEPHAGEMFRTIHDHAYPNLYHDVRIGGVELAAAAKLQDLDPAQTAAIEAMSADYARADAALNAETEAALDRQPLLTGMMDIVVFREESGRPDPLGELATRRETLEHATQKKLWRILTPDQRERIVPNPISL